MLIKHSDERLHHGRIEICCPAVIMAEGLHPIAHFICCVIHIKLNKFRRVVIWRQQGSDAVMNLSAYFEDRRASSIIYAAIYVCPHGRKSKEAVILPYCSHKLVGDWPAIKLASETRGSGRGRSGGTTTLPPLQHLL